MKGMLMEKGVLNVLNAVIEGSFLFLQLSNKRGNTILKSI